MSVLSFRRREARLDQVEEASSFQAAVLHGLSQRKKSIPARFFYDKRGSELFEQITALDEYYPTRAELSILSTYGEEIAAAAADARALVEFGAGSTRKIRLILNAMPFLEVYAPIDISGEFLGEEARQLAEDYPRLRIVPVVADFMGPVSLPEDVLQRRRLAFFPGSTIGNFVPREGLHLLERMRQLIGSGGAALIGVDLKKDVDTLLAAYDDAEGVTAAFNLNLLQRANRELGANFDSGAFAHEVRYNEGRGCIEMHLRSLRAQTVRIGAVSFTFTEDETIHTEDSHKFTMAEFRLLARASGLEPAASWVDAEQRFSVHLLRYG